MSRNKKYWSIIFIIYFYFFYLIFYVVVFFFTEILFNRFLFFSLITIDDNILFIWFV